MIHSPTPPDPVEVVIVGRANIDLTVRVPFHPTAGQTAFASPVNATPGGKSLNQAIAAATLGGRVGLIANAGDDVWGRQLAAALAEASVDASHFRLIPGVPTGAAIIEVTPDGDNSIVLALSPGTELTPQDVHEALVQVTAPVVVQLDLPPDVLNIILTLPRPRPVVGNLVPSRGLDPQLLQRLDVIIVNHEEAAAILDAPGIDPLDAARSLRLLGPAAAVVTDGPRGAAYSRITDSAIVPAPPVDVADTTGAGDAFLGSLALDLSRGTPFPLGVTRAVLVASEAVKHHGARLNIIRRG